MPPPARSRSLTPTPATALRPEKAAIPDVRHITKQLAPRSASGGSPVKRQGQVASIFNRVQRQSEIRMNVSVDKLKHLGIDPEVFFALPPSDQREQLRSMEQAYEQRLAQALRSPVQTAQHHDTNRLSRSPSVGRGRAKRDDVAPTVASYLTKPAIKQRLSKNQEPVHIKSTEDVQSLLSSWVESAIPTGKPPDLKTDVPVFSKFLIACVQQETGSDAIERAISIMRWWSVLIERLAVAPPFRNRPAAVEAWRNAFKFVKKSLDDEVLKRFGCSLAL